jgi:hypothetical protein
LALSFYSALLFLAAGYRQRRYIANNLKVTEMKLTLFLLAFSLFFFACESSVDPAEKQNQIGVIHKIEVSTWMYGTHTLNDAGGKPIYALTSSTIDLNNFENKEVKISGNLIEGYPVDGGPLYLNVTIVSLIK